MTTEQLRQKARAYYALVEEAERAGVPVSLEDPRSPRTVVGLRLAVELVRDAGHSVDAALDAARAYERSYSS